MDKKSLRLWAKSERKKLDIESVSSVLSKKLEKTKEYKMSKNIMLFYPLAGEVNLLSIMKNSEKFFYLPRINNDELVCCRYIAGDKLVDSNFHTKEPICDACSKTDIDLVIVPALACDKNNYRLGYGGGFYDRFLSNYNGLKVCCVPKELFVESVYPEKHDVRMDIVLTD